MGTKTTKSTRFLNQDKKKTSLVPNLDHETKKNKNKNTIRAKQKFNEILLQGKYKNITRL
jgi:hypothetical protein